MRAYAKNLGPQKVGLQAMLWPYGISISNNDRKTWESLKLVPAMPEPPSTEAEQLEETTGRWWDEWANTNPIIAPEILLAEYAAAAYLLKRCSWSEAEVRIGRFHLASAVEANDDPIRKLDEFFSGPDGITGREEQYIEAFAWLMTVIKFALGFPAQAGIEAVAVPSPDGGFVYTARPADEDSICCTDGNSRHPREFKLPEAEIMA